MSIMQYISLVKLQTVTSCKQERETERLEESESVTSYILSAMSPLSLVSL